MFGTKDVPVYLFTGFLESGKTRCIREVIEEGNFTDGKRSLLILTEEGEEELDDMLLAANKIDMITVENEEEFTEKVCFHNLRKYRSDRVIIEVNGMWNLDRIYNEILPENWIVIQTFTTVNAQTFDMYVNNMKSMMMAHFQMSDLVIFNRCTSDMNKPSMRRNVKAINRMAQVMFESEDGSVENNIEEELPYDINASEITLEDDDFGLWYLDVTEHPERYEDKTITFKGQVYRSKNFPSGTFVPARAAMTCCADDIQKIGFLCHAKEAEALDVNSWVKVSVKVKSEFNPQYQQMYPVLWADSVTPDEPPAEEVVYFS
ncbi:MAG: GTPase [Eubacterium sp.]|nr:GTPase [Eubacterium sp.]